MTDKVKLLIVDDEALAAEYLRRSLQDLPNCEVRAVCSGKRALRVLRQESFDVLITDFNMPNMDGRTLTARVHKLYPQMVVIMVSGCIDYALRQWVCASAFIQDLLEKPVDPEQIRRVVLGSLAA